MFSLDFHYLCQFLFDGEVAAKVQLIIVKKKSYIGYLILPILVVLLFLLSDNTRFQQKILRPALTSSLQKQGLFVELDSVRWHWNEASLELYRVSCSDADGRSFASAEQLECNIRVLPLLWRQLHIQALRVESLQCYPSSELNLPIFTRNNKSKPLKIKIDRLLVTSSSVAFQALDIQNLQAKLSVFVAPNLQTLQIEDLSFVNASDGFELSHLQVQASLENASLLRIPQLRLELPSSYIYSDSIELQCPSFCLDSLALLKEFRLQAQLSSADIPWISSKFQEAHLDEIELQMNVQAQGDMHDLTIGQCQLYSQNDLVAMDGSARVSNLNQSSRQWQSAWKHISVDPLLIEYYKALFPHETLSLPEDILYNLGKSSFEGNIASIDETLSMNGHFYTQPGDFEADVNLQKRTDGFYDGSAKIDIPAYRLDELLDEEILQGNTSVRLQAQAKALGSKYAQLKANAHLRSFPFNQYEYQHIDLQAQADLRGLYTLSIDAKDPECLFDADFQVDRRAPMSDWQAKFDAQYINLQALHLLEGQDEKAHLSFAMDAHLKGDTIDRLWGDVRLDSIDFYHHATTYRLPSLLISNHKESNNYAHLQVQSNQINADVYGDMGWSQFYRELQSQVLAEYLPSVFSASKRSGDVYLSNQFAFRVDVSSTDSLAKAFSWPISLVDTAHIEGYYYDEKDVFALSIMADSLRVQDQVLHQTHLMLDNKAYKTMDLSLSTHFPTSKDNFLINMDAKALSDTLDMTIQVDLAQSLPFALSNSRHLFGRDSADMLSCCSKLYVPYVQWKGATWQLDTAHVDYVSNRLYVEDFAFHNDDQYIQMDGLISESPYDSLYLKVSQLNLAHITQLFPPKKTIPKPMSFGGIISADASLRALLSKPEFDADLSVAGFSMNQHVMGELDATTRWNNETSSLDIVSQVHSGDMHTGVIEGFYSPMADSLYLDISAEGLPLNFISYYLEPMMTLGAQVYGDVEVFAAPLRQYWDVVADAYVSEGDLYSPALNVRYTFSDSIRLMPGVILFDQIDLYDVYSNHALFNGRIRHRNFAGMEFDLDLAMQRLHLMDLPMSDQAFYGEIEASGKARMSGNEKDIRIDLDIQTEDHTNFYLSLANNTADSNYSFIEFVNAEDKNCVSIEKKNTTVDEEAAQLLPTNLSIDMNLDITPTANLIFVTNPAAGDEMRMSGNGTLRLSYDSKDDLQLFGRYELDKGKYGFTFQDLIHRDFNILQGSSINFSGDLMSANLDINANHSVLNVELSDILDEAELSSMNLNRTSIPVNCQLNILGELQQPEIVLGLDFPSADEELRRRIMNIINTDEILNRQIVSLLLLNRFAMTENVQNSEAATNNNMSAVMDIGLNSLSNQLNRIIYQAMGSDNLSFDLNYRYDDMAEGLGEWQVAMSSQLLNNRLVINGNIGSREDLVNDNTQFIGDFDAEYKFSRDGRLRGKFFNRTNDSRYFKSAMTTQGVGVVYKENFHSFSELRHKINAWIARRITHSKADSDINVRKNKNK